VLYERWRQAIELTTGTLLGTGLLTPDGVSLVAALRERAQCRDAAAVPAEATEIVGEVALDNWLTWQLRHTVLDSAAVRLHAAAYQRGEPSGDLDAPATWLEEDSRKVEYVARSRVLHMRFQEPRRYRQVSAGALAELGAADALLIGGEAGAAVTAYRERLTAGPDPAAWIGLALAVHRLPAMSSRQPVFTSRLPLLSELHSCLAERGIRADPLDLADWLK
jgi:hypothetical protein